MVGVQNIPDAVGFCAEIRACNPGSITKGRLVGCGLLKRPRCVAVHVASLRIHVALVKLVVSMSLDAAVLVESGNACHA